MKRKRIVLFAILGLAAVLLYPFAINIWWQRRVEKRVAYIRDIFDAISTENMEREPLGRPRVKTLEEVLDDKLKQKMMKDGIDWREYHYFPQADEAPDTTVLLSITYNDSIVLVKKGGGIFKERKKYANLLIMDAHQKGEPGYAP